MRRGFLRFYVLKLISKSETPISGYTLMKRIEEETGFWRPSPGSIYPLLASLEKEGLIVHRRQDDKKLYSLTPAGMEKLKLAQQAKDEVMRGVRQSIHIFGELFGEEASGNAGLLTDPAKFEQSLPEDLRKSFRTLRALLHAVLTQHLSATEATGITKIINHTIEELKGYVKDD